jgi:membrane-bound metal-dependent hydrolase YbcI (DUF457 family)
MMLRTHLAISAFFILLMIPYVNEPAIFSCVAVFSTILPDIDSRFSSIGRKTISRILQFFTKHRGVIHSFTFMMFLTLIFALFAPVIALPFFLGYALHLIADSFTPAGIRAFYPSKSMMKGKLKTGGKIEMMVFSALVAADIFMLLSRISIML